MVNVNAKQFKPAPAQDEAPAGRAFYATVIGDDGRVGFLAGPYQLHSAALAAVAEAKEKAYAADPRAHWYAFGTVQHDAGGRTVFGVL